MTGRRLALSDPLDADDLAARRDHLRQQLAAIGDLRPGSLFENYRKCGKPTCRCAAKDHPGHGPYWLLTGTVGGKPRSRSIPAAQVEATNAQIAECQRLCRLVAELIAVSDDLCQARLKPGSSAVRREPPRLSSTQPSKPKSLGS